jgi:formylglycine-generating enzyme required for sulfatase activity
MPCWYNDCLFLWRHNHPQTSELCSITAIGRTSWPRQVWSYHGSRKLSLECVGLHDMHGNVWEWVEDEADMESYVGAPTNGSPVPSLGGPRVIRGGSWDYGWECWRSAMRGRYPASRVQPDIGFRVARVVDRVPGGETAEWQVSEGVRAVLRSEYGDNWQSVLGLRDP